MNLLLYWYFENQSLSFLDHVNPFILVYGYITDQGTIDPSYFFCDLPHRGVSSLFTDSSTVFEQFEMTMAHIDISPFESMLLVVAPYVAALSIHV